MGEETQTADTSDVRPEAVKELVNAMAKLLATHGHDDAEIGKEAFTELVYGKLSGDMVQSQKAIDSLLHSREAAFHGLCFAAELAHDLLSVLNPDADSPDALVETWLKAAGEWAARQKDANEKKQATTSAGPPPNR